MERTVEEVVAVAQMASADTLVLLSDIDGLYTADPRTDPAATLIPEVRQGVSKINLFSASIFV